MMMCWIWLLLSTVLSGAASAFVPPGGGAHPRLVVPRTIGASGSSSGSSLKMVAGAGIGVLPSRNLAVAGRIPWQKLRLTKPQALQILNIMRTETHTLDVAVVFVLSVFPDRIGKFLYERIFYRLRKNVKYEDSITYQVTENISQAARIAAVCYAIDAIEVALEVSGIKGRKMDVSSLIAKLIYVTWACFRARLYKRNLFDTFLDKTAPKKVKEGKEGIVDIFDKISDVFVFMVLALIYIDILNIKLGSGLSSIFALGGVSTFVFTLACQDLARRALNGLALSASDAFTVGDSILLGDGTSGTVMNTGWLVTEIKGQDELITRIPNSQLSNIRITNRSRMRFSQVKQELYFRHEDIDKIPALVTEIREEIAASVPKVITDGSRPFRVKWVDYEYDYIKVVVDCRLRNPPMGEGYFDARQSILEAIARAVKRKKVEFAVPTEMMRGK